MSSRYLPDVLRGDRGKPGLPGAASVVPGPPGPPGPPGLAEWQRIFDVQFSDLAPTTFVDGIYSLGDGSFEVVRTASAASSSGIVAGGLRVPCNSLSSLSAYKGDGFIVQVPNFSSIVPPGIPIRSVLVLDRVTGPTALNTGFVVHGVWNPTQYNSTTPESETVAVSCMSNGPFSALAGIFARHSCNNTRATFDGGVIAQVNRFGIVLPSSYYLGLTDRCMLQGTSVDDPEHLSSWPMFQGNYGSNGYDILDGTRARSNFQRSDMNLFVGYQSTDNTALCSVIISRWRLEAFF
jgi:hypothetical protein